jgi:WD40 repeat protein
VASAIRGVPKDELESEEVRQHRRTIRTAWAAGVVVLLLGVAATVGAVIAINESSEAQDQRDEAQRQAEIAQTNEQRAVAAEQEAVELARQEAESAQEAARQAEIALMNEARAIEGEAEARRQEAEAKRQEAEALRQAQLARSRELAAAAVSQQEEDPELAMMLALEALVATPEGSQASTAGVISLRQSLIDNRLVQRVPVPEGLLSVRLGHGGGTLYYSTELESHVSAVDLSTGSTLWMYSDPDTDDRFGRIDISANGSLLAVSLQNVTSPGEDDGKTSRVVVLNTADGSVRAVIPAGACAVAHSSGFSPDGRLLAVSSGGSSCKTDAGDSWVALVDTATWEEAHRLYLESARVEEVTFATEMPRLLVHEVFDTGSIGADLISLTEFETLLTIEGAGLAALSPDGTRAVAMVESDRVELRPELIDLEDGSRIAFLDAVDGFLVSDIDSSFSFSPNGAMVFVGTRAHDYIFDAVAGQLLFQVGAGTPTVSHAFTPDSSTLVTASADGAMLVFDLTAGPAAEAVALDFPSNNPVWINGNRAVEGPEVAITVLTVDRSILDIAIGVLDPVSGEVVASYQGEGVQLTDGRFVVNPSQPIDTDGEPDHLVGPLAVWDPATGQTTDLTTCAAALSSFDEANHPGCSDGEYLWGQGLLNRPAVGASRDGSVFAASAFVANGTPRPVRVWDGQTLSVVSEFTVPWDYDLVAAGSEWLAFLWWERSEVAIYDLDGRMIGTYADRAPTTQGLSSLDDSLFFVLGLSGGVNVLDTTSAELVASWAAHASTLRGAGISPDGTRLATTGEDNFVNIWDITGLRDLAVGVPPPLIDRIPAPFPSDAVWLDDETLLIFLAEGARYVEVSLNVNPLVAQARARLTRGFEPDECAIHQIEDCPTTLEGIRNRG